MKNMDNGIRAAIIGAVGLVITAVIGYFAAIRPVEKEIAATQTAEAKTSTVAQSSTSTTEPTQTLVPTETLAPTITQTLPPTLTPTPIVIDTDSLIGWMPFFGASYGDAVTNKVSLNEDENAIEITYELGEFGYITLGKRLDAKILSETEGVHFLYRGRGTPNTIEFKLLLIYPDDNGDTTYGKLWNRATDTNDKWVEVNILYRDMQCWWPEENCEKHGDLLDIRMLDKLEFAISNKVEDDEGSGWILIKDIQAIDNK